MRLLFIAIFLFTALSCTFQSTDETGLPVPSKKLIKAKDTSFEIGYLYLLDNWKIIRAKEVTKKFSECQQENCDCEWNIKFENNILYEFENCEEHGNSVRITFENVKKEEIIKLINSLFENSENIWKDNYTKYEPKESGDPGCYYEIIENNNSVTLDYYCGC